MTPRHQLPYRPDVDGIRAIAVVAVIVFHAFPALCRGGLIGVDIFFVISGYLISGVILTGLSRGDFSFSGFYARRVRRIFPALSLLLAFCLAAGWYLLTPNEWRELAKNTIAGAGFFSNLLPGNLNYFDPPAQTQPLLHLWSLGIEEQFYILWPLALVLLWKLRTKAGKRGDNVLTGILLIAVASFAVDVKFLHLDPVLTFYNPLARAWELLTGAALARYTLTCGGVKRARNREILSASGALLVAASLVLLNEGKPFPGWWTLLPVVGTAFLIGAGPAAWFNRRVLAARPFVATGLISYPLYLWHWPLLVFLRLVLQSDFSWGLKQTTAAIVAVLMLTLILSWATYRFWETPWRFSFPLSPARRVNLLVAGMTGVAVLAFAASWIVPPRLNSAAMKELEIARTDIRELGNWKMKPLRVFEFPSLSTHATLLVGDSHMEQFIPRAEAAIKADPQFATAVFATSGSCPPLPGINENAPGFQCPVFYDYWLALARQSRFSTVAISAFWESYRPNENPLWDQTFHGHLARTADYDEAWQGLAADLKTLVDAGKRVVLIASTPVWPTLDPESGFSRLRRTSAKQPFGVSRTSLEQLLEPVTRKLNETALYSGAEIVSPRDYLCNARNCPALDTDGTPIYRDSNHIRASKAARLATFIDDVLR